MRAAMATRPPAMCALSRPSARRFCLDRWRGAGTGGLCDPHRGPLLEAGRSADADGHRMGQGRPGRQALHRPGPPGDRRLAPGRGHLRDLHVEGHGPRCWRPAARSEKRSHPARFGWSSMRATSPPSSRGRCWLPKSTSPDWEPVMKTAAAIVTSHGGRTCHAAIVARELGVPAVVGAEGAVETLAERRGRDRQLRRRRSRQGL